MQPSATAARTLVGRRPTIVAASWSPRRCRCDPGPRRRPRRLRRPCPSSGGQAARRPAASRRTPIELIVPTSSLPSSDLARLAQCFVGRRAGNRFQRDPRPRGELLVGQQLRQLGHRLLASRRWPVACRRWPSRPARRVCRTFDQFFFFRSADRRPLAPKRRPEAELPPARRGELRGSIESYPCLWS